VDFRNTVNRKVPLVNNYAETIKQARAKLRLTQQEFADLLYLSRNYIAKIETGDKQPSLRVLKAVEALVSPGNKSEGTHPPSTQIPPRIAQTLDRRLRHLLELAGDNPKRLCWLLEQFDAHLQVPRHWAEQAQKEAHDEATQAYGLDAESEENQEGRSQGFAL
jgi:transcriptional regulator with XRE-family HTH domain